MRSLLRPLSSLSLCALLPACATTLTSFETAEPVERGHVRAVGGVGFYGPLGSTIDAIDAGKDEAAKLARTVTGGEPYRMSSDEAKRLAAAAIALAVLPPAPTYTFSARTGVATDWDVGLRYSVNAVRLDTKYRFYRNIYVIESRDEAQVRASKQSPPPPSAVRSFDLAAGFGVSRYLFSNPVVDVLEYAQLGDFSRWDFELPLYASYRAGEVLQVYGGPRWIYGRVSMDTELVALSSRGEATTNVDLRIPSLVHVHFFGATAGAALGFRHVHLLFELTGGYTRCRPSFLGERRDIGGVTFHPAIGVALSL